MGEEGWAGGGETNGFGESHEDEERVQVVRMREEVHDRHRERKDDLRQPRISKCSPTNEAKRNSDSPTACEPWASYRGR